jgi:3D (Asp-Asp-Asp) domain-containing protein
MAASNQHPFGTRLRVQSVGVVTVQDRIGHGSDLDLFMDSRAACIRFGRRRLTVTVLR